MKRRSNYLNNIKLGIIAIISVILGIVTLFYPIVSNYLAEQNQTEVIQKYDETIASLSGELNIEEEFEKAEIYNDNLTGETLHDPFVFGSGYALPENYSSILNINDGVMGYIEIPKISLNLPIYHGTSQETLEKGVGHIERTTLPIGGISRHCVLTGHRGLPNAKLFTELDKLKCGDYFNLHILNKILTYKIYNIEVIEPTDIEKLQVIPDKDIVTLVTCTPYGINTHRLLVHAERTENIETENEEDKEKVVFDIEEMNYTTIGVAIGGIILIIIIVIYILINLKRGKNGEKNWKKKRKV